MRKDDTVRLRHMLDAAQVEDLPPLIAELKKVTE